MMMVTLTRPESRDSGLHDRNSGPLRRLYEDVNHLNRRLHSLEDEVRHLKSSIFNKEASYNEAHEYDYPYEKFSLQQQIANIVDQDVLNQLKTKNVAKVKGLLGK
jgi:vacuolar-type H+-ATPase subunit I/STV1